MSSGNGNIDVKITSLRVRESMSFGTGSGSINGTTRLDNESFRVGNGTGVYGLGSQRQIEFGLRFVF